MHIQDYSGDPAAVISTALASPTFRKTPDKDTALRLVAKEVETRFKELLTSQMVTELEWVRTEYELLNGEYADNFADEAQKSEYESGIDDQVEVWAEAYVDQLSANWLGTSTIDSGAWTAEGVAALATSAAKEVFKNLVDGKTQAQMLASAGVLTSDVETAMMVAQTQGNADMGTQPSTDLDATFASIIARVGADFDQMAVYEDIEVIVTEDDEVLISSAADRLGIGQPGIDALQIAALEYDEDAASELVERLASFKPAKPAKAKPAKAPVAKPKEDGEPPLDNEILVALKHCGAQDSALAESLGLSRSTYGKYVNGQTAFRPDSAQYATLRAEIVDRANRLLVALHQFDGTELVEVA